MLDSLLTHGFTSKYISIDRVVKVGKTPTPIVAFAGDCTPLYTLLTNVGYFDTPRRFMLATVDSLMLNDMRYLVERQLNETVNSETLRSSSSRYFLVEE